MMQDFIKDIALTELGLEYLFADPFDANLFQDNFIKDFLILDEFYTYSLFSSPFNHRNYTITVWIGGNSRLDKNATDRIEGREKYEIVMEQFLNILNLKEEILDNVETGTISFQKNYLDSNKDVVFQTFNFKIKSTAC